MKLEVLILKVISILGQQKQQKTKDQGLLLEL